MTDGKKLSTPQDCRFCPASRDAIVRLGAELGVMSRAELLNQPDAQLGRMSQTLTPFLAYETFILQIADWSSVGCGLLASAAICLFASP